MMIIAMIIIIIIIMIITIIVIIITWALCCGFIVGAYSLQFAVWSLEWPNCGSSGRVD